MFYNSCGSSLLLCLSFSLLLSIYTRAIYFLVPWFSIQSSKKQSSREFFSTSSSSRLAQWGVENSLTRWLLLLQRQYTKSPFQRSKVSLVLLFPATYALCANWKWWNYRRGENELERIFAYTWYNIEGISNRGKRKKRVQVNEAQLLFAHRKARVLLAYVRLDVRDDSTWRHIW